MVPVFFGIDGGVLTGVSACAEYGLCAGSDFYTEYRIQGSSNYLAEGSYIHIISSSEPFEVVEMCGQQLVSKYQAIVDACYFYHDDSALTEIFEELEYEGELDNWISYAKSANMDLSLLQFVLSMFTDTYRDTYEGTFPLILSNRSLFT